jgi:ABC-type uncharacterized transport system auxiliary subunit
MTKLWLALLAGCALTSRSAPLEVRYFAPPSHPTAAAAPRTSAGPLRLGRITPSSLLRERIVHRDSDVELVPYETLRWSDRPETYVRRALARALFDTGAFEQALGGGGPVLDVDVISFEELRRGPARFGRVALGYQMHDDHRVLAHGVVAIERPAGPGIEGVVAAIGGALDAAAAELAHRIDVAPPAHE